jgi:hypothetical protein
MSFARHAPNEVDVGRVAGVSELWYCLQSSNLKRSGLRTTGRHPQLAEGVKV